MLQAGHAVAPGVSDAAVLIHAERTTGRIGSVERSEDAVDTCRLVVSRASDVLCEGTARQSEREESDVTESDVAMHVRRVGVDGDVGSETRSDKMRLARMVREALRIRRRR